MPEARVAAGVATYLRFDAPFDKASLEFEGRPTRFRWVDVGERLVAVEPSVDLGAEEKLVVRVRYKDGASPAISRIVRGDGNLPEGTLLHGRLWTGPGIYDYPPEFKRPAVMGRYTLAVLPDGRKYPVCIVLGDKFGRVPKHEGSKEGAAVLNRELPVTAVWRWE